MRAILLALCYPSQCMAYATSSLCALLLTPSSAPSFWDSMGITPFTPLSGRRRRPAGLTSVRRSNRTCSFPASSFHKGTPVAQVKRRNQFNKVHKTHLAIEQGFGQLACTPCPLMSEPSLNLLDSANPKVSSDNDFWVFHLWNLSSSFILLTFKIDCSNYLCQPPSPAHSAVP